MPPTYEEPTYRRKHAHDSRLQNRLECVKIVLGSALLLSCLLLVLDCDEIESEMKTMNDKSRRGLNKDDGDEKEEM